MGAEHSAPLIATTIKPGGGWAAGPGGARRPSRASPTGSRAASLTEGVVAAAAVADDLDVAEPTIVSRGGKPPLVAQASTDSEASRCRGARAARRRGLRRGRWARRGGAGGVPAEEELEAELEEIKHARAIWIEGVVPLWVYSDADCDPHGRVAEGTKLERGFVYLGNEACASSSGG